MNTINLKYFGMIAEITGKESESMAFNGTIGELAKELLDRHPDLKEKRIQFAVNQNMATSDHSLNAGDEVAVLPPFTGG